MIDFIEDEFDKKDINSLLCNISINECSSDASTEILNILSRKSKISSSKSLNSGLIIPLPKKINRINSSIHIPRISKPSLIEK